MAKTVRVLPRILEARGNEILEDWIRFQRDGDSRGSSMHNESEQRANSSEFLSLFERALRSSEPDVMSPAWAEVREFLARLSRTRAQQGAMPADTAMFVFSLKQALLVHLRAETSLDGDGFADEVWASTLLLDRLGLYTTELHQKSREEVIIRQQQELLELSTPVVRLWEGVLALPLIGTLDSARTQIVMENLLQEIVSTGAAMAIIDITGVPTVDTLVAQHLLKTVAAARLMGADCIISGIRPQIAQTIVHLGVDLEDVITKATLADAFMLALRRNGLGVRRIAATNGNQ
jgi:rsbT co-antagonist protein RsbR